MCIRIGRLLGVCTRKAGSFQSSTNWRRARHKNTHWQTKAFTILLKCYLRYEKCMHLQVHTQVQHTSAHRLWRYNCSTLTLHNSTIHVVLQFELCSLVSWSPESLSPDPCFFDIVCAFPRVEIMYVCVWPTKESRCHMPCLTIISQTACLFPHHGAPGQFPQTLNSFIFALPATKSTKRSHFLPVSISKSIVQGPFQSVTKSVRLRFMQQKADAANIPAQDYNLVSCTTGG